MLLQVGDHSLYYEEYGPARGFPVVLLHHGLGSVEAWREQRLPLVEAGFRVIAYDRWGYGRSSPRLRLSIPYFTEDRKHLEALLDHLGVERAALVGHSDGGTLALYYTAERPGRIAGLVTIAAHIYVEAKMKPGIETVRQEFENPENRLRSGLQRRHGEKGEAVFWGWFDGWTGSPEAVRDWDLRATLRQIRCPTLVVQGMEDEHATPQHAIDLAEAIPGAELWLVPEAGHMLPQERPEAFNRLLVEFLKGVTKDAV